MIIKDIMLTINLGTLVPKDTSVKPINIFETLKFSVTREAP